MLKTMVDEGFLGKKYEIRLFLTAFVFMLKYLFFLFRTKVWKRILYLSRWQGKENGAKIVFSLIYKISISRWLRVWGRLHERWITLSNR